METTISINQQLINTLLLNASFIDNLGLLNGKMGNSICFFHLARQTKNKIYEEYAGELIDEFFKEITSDTPVDFENGLVGIGWGIDGLVQNILNVQVLFADPPNDDMEPSDDLIFNCPIPSDTVIVGGSGEIIIFVIQITRGTLIRIVYSRLKGRGRIKINLFSLNRPVDKLFK